jgi:hypothetical protein
MVANRYLIAQLYLILNCRVKDKKVGEGTYAVVYQGAYHKRLMEAMLF